VEIGIADLSRTPVTIYQDWGFFFSQKVYALYLVSALRGATAVSSNKTLYGSPQRTVEKVQKIVIATPPVAGEAIFNHINQ
jgi:hypothetical protein